MTKYSAFTALPAVIFCLASIPTQTRADPVIYAAGFDTGRLIRIDLGTGAVTNIGPSLGVSGAMGFAFGPDGRAYTVTQSRLATVDLHTGKATVVGSTGAGMGLAFSPDGTLYGVGSGSLWKVDPATAKATRVGAHTGNTMDLAFHPDGTLYAIEPSALFRFDATTGKWTLVKSLSGVSNPMGLVISSDGTFYASDYVNPAVVVRIDVTTGQTTPVIQTKIGPFCGIGLLPEPKLRISRQASEMTLSWPEWESESFVLEVSSMLPALEWQPVAASPTANGGLRSVTIRPAEFARFYRLRRP